MSVKGVEDVAASMMSGAVSADTDGQEFLSGKKSPFTERWKYE
jgi:hypothetical protein